MKSIARFTIASLLLVGAASAAVAQDSTAAPTGNVGYTAPPDPTTGYVMTENMWCRGGAGSTTIICDQAAPADHQPDNLGDHQATTAINVNNFGLSNAGPISGATNIAASGQITAGGAVSSPSWLSPTYGGGWYMADANWLRSYDNKGIFTGGTIYTAGSLRADVNLNVGGTAYATAYLHNSDRTLKDHIQPITDPFALLDGIVGSRYNWKSNGVAAYGVIAQDVQSVMPEAVKEVEEGDRAGTLAVEYDQLIAPMIEAIKLLKADNDNMRAEIEALKAAAN